MSSRRARIVILASGSGTNAEAVMAACDSGELSAEVVAVVTNNPAAGVLTRAERFGVATVVVTHESRDRDQRQAEDAALISTIAELVPDIVVLAGWMRILGAAVGQAFPIINLHPAKPGEFPGTRAIERAFDAWVEGTITESGVMVHWVPDEGVDVGPTIATESVAFVETDDLESFAARMHETEHRLLVAALRQAIRQLESRDS